MEQEKDFANVRVGVWMNENGHMFSHSNGLTEEQVEMFHSLQVGDRLVLFKNKDENRGLRPHYNIGKSTRVQNRG